MKNISLANPNSHPLAHCASKAISLQVQYRFCSRSFGVEHSLPWKVFLLFFKLDCLRSQEPKYVLFILVLFRLQVAPIPEEGASMQYQRKGTHKRPLEACSHFLRTLSLRASPLRCLSGRRWKQEAQLIVTGVEPTLTQKRLQMPTCSLVSAWTLVSGRGGRRDPPLAQL